MDLLSFLAANVKFPSGSGLGVLINGLLEGLYNLVGSYGVAIILFTLVLRTIMLPLDFGNKYFTKKNANKLAEFKPELDNINKIYAGDMMARNRAQQEVYKRNGYSQGGFCFFMLINLVVTLVVFITVFGCLRDISNYNINKQFVELQAVYQQYEAEGKLDTPEFAKAMNEKYDDTTVSFLWVKNFWRPDSWSSQTMGWNEFKSSVSGVSGNVFDSKNYVTEGMKKSEKEAAKKAYEAKLKAEYNAIFKPIDKDHGGWNGLLLLVVLAGVTMYFSAVINANQMKKKAEEKKTTEEVVRYSMRATRAAPDSTAMPEINTAMMGGMMKILLPVVMVFFTLFNTAALALYITTGAVITIGYTFINNTIVDKILKRQGNKPKDCKVDGSIINPHAKYFKKK